MNHLTTLIDGLFEASKLESDSTCSDRDSCVREILKSSATVAQSAVILANNQHSYAMAILARPILENLINLCWLILSRDNAITYINNYKFELQKILKINIENGNASIFDKNGNKVNFIDEFTKYKKPPSIADKAKIANISEIYDIFYRTLCLNTHGNIDISKSNEDLNTNNDTDIYIKAIGALIMSIGHVSVNWLLYRNITNKNTLADLLNI
ncbi:DUF5677 domain-containing protein [Aeromonas veronii]|uniref:DUF5677 domain-containing protein n=1 Tax=Aeromonas veronii TaxID=654 RepID=UPI003B9E64AF